MTLSLTDVFAFLNFLLFRFDLGEYDQAAEEYGRVLDMATSAGLNEFCTLAHVQKARCLAAKGDFAAALEVGGNLTDFVCNTRVSTVLYMGILYIAGEYFQKPEYVLVTHAHTHTHTHTHTHIHEAASREL